MNQLITMSYFLSILSTNVKMEMLSILNHSGTFNISFNKLLKFFFNIMARVIYFIK